jgi:hypothetical protein
VSWAAAKAMVEAKYGAENVSYFHPSPNSSVYTSAHSTEEDSQAERLSSRAKESDPSQVPARFDRWLGSNLPTLSASVLSAYFAYQNLKVENFYLYAGLIVLALIAGFALLVLLIRVLPRWLYTIAGLGGVSAVALSRLDLGRFNWTIPGVSAMSDTQKQNTLIFLAVGAVVVLIGGCVIGALFHLNHKRYSEKFGWHDFAPPAESVLA